MLSLMALVKIVVRQILQLQLIGLALQAAGVCGAHDRVGQLPDLAHGVLKGSVAVHHDLDLSARGAAQALCKRVHKAAAIAREQLHAFLRGLV